MSPEITQPVLIILTSLLFFLALACNRAKKPGWLAWFQIVLLALLAVLSWGAAGLDGNCAKLLSLGLLAIAALGGSLPAAYFVGRLQKSEKKAESDGRWRAYSQVASSNAGEAGADGGGRYIGNCERLAVILALITGQGSLIPVVLAVKGLARYPEIKSGQLTAEKFVVGTFISLLWASVCAVTALNLLASGA